MAGAQRETEPEELIGQDHVACQVHFLRGVETHLNVKQRADLRDLNFEFDQVLKYKDPSTHKNLPCE